MAKKKPSNSVNIIDDPRFPKVRAQFKKRGMGELALVAMVRVVIDEWLATNADKDSMIRGRG